MSGETSPEQARQHLRKLVSPECRGCNTPPSMVFVLSKQVGEGVLSLQNAKIHFNNMFSSCEGPEPDLTSTEIDCQLPPNKPEQAA